MLRHLVLIVLLSPAFLCAQSTLYWAGNAHDPAVGGDGIWTNVQSDQSWSSAAGSYVPVAWSDRVNNTDSAVLSGTTSGLITMNRALNGTTLTLTRDYTINLTPANYVMLAFDNLVFTGSATKLTLTGGGGYRGGIGENTVILDGAATTFYLQADTTNDSGGTIIARAGTMIKQSGLVSRSSEAALQLQNDAVVEAAGTVGPISSASAGGGVIQCVGLGAGGITSYYPAGTFEYSGIIRDRPPERPQAGPLNFKKTGPGTLILSGAQKTHTGGTVIAEGVLRLIAANILSAQGQVTVGQGATEARLLLEADQTIGSLAGTSKGSIELGNATLTVGYTDYAGSISGAGRIVKTAGSSMALSGNNTYTGGTVVAGGTLVVGLNNSFGSGPVTFKSGSYLSMGGTPLTKDFSFESGEVGVVGALYSSSTLSGVLSGSALLNFIGGVTLTGANTYSGGTKITDGTLTVGSDAALGAAGTGITMVNGKLQWSQSFDLAPARAITLTGANALLPNGFATTLAQNISGTGSLQIGSTGTVTLSGQNSFSGGLMVDAGILLVNSATALGAAEGAIIVGGGTLRFTTPADLGTVRSFKIRPIYVGAFPSNGISVDDGVVVNIPVPITNASTSIMDKASLVKTGTGTLRLSAPSNYDGSTIVKGGILQLGASNILPVSHKVELSGGSLDLAGYTQTLDRVTGGGQILLNGGALTLTTPDDITSYGIVGDGTVYKTGPGKLELYPNGLFAGVFRVQAGTLFFGNQNPLGAGSTILLSAGATLSGFGSIDKLGVGGGANVSPGTQFGSASITTLAAGDTAWEPGSRYVFQWRSSFSGPAGTGRDHIAITGQMQVKATPGSPMVIKVISSDINANAGLLSGFNAAQNYAFPIITTTAGITGFTGANIVLDLSGFQNSYTGTFRLILTNGGKDLTLRYRENSFAKWGEDYFSSGELADPAIGGASADPDSDGLSNLVEYALGFEPKVMNTSGLPEMMTVGEDWVYTYARPKNLPDVTYVVEVCSDLSSWTTTNVSHEKVSTAGEVETWRARYPVAMADNAFFRLKVTQL